MFESTKLDLAQYTPVGDIAVMTLSVIMAFLVRKTYISSNRQRFFNLVLDLIFLFIGSASNIIYQMMLNSEVLRPGPIYLFRLLHGLFISGALLLYIRYLQEPLWVHAKMKQIYTYVTYSLTVFVVCIDLIMTGAHIGFYVTKEGEYHAGVDPYILLYAVFIVTIMHMLVRYRSRLLKNVFVSLIGVNLLSVLMIFIQERHQQVSYTSLSYFFPIIGIVFLFHSNPFNIDSGAVSSDFFYDEIKKNTARNKEMLIMCCTLNGFSTAIAQDPEFKTEFYKFFRQNVKKGVLYHFPNERLVLTMVKNKKIDYEKYVETMLESFKQSHKVFKIDYKITVLETTDKVLSVNDYYQIIEYSESTRPINTIHIITPDDIRDYYNKNYILTQLKDIAARKDLSDPRVLVYCQPVFNISTGRYDTAEALMRLNLEKTGLVFPDKFIPIAEDYNLIHMLSMIILNKTCFAIHGFVGEGYDVKRISVNFSAIDIRCDSFCDEVKTIIESNCIDYNKIAVEITESRSEADFNVMKQRVMELQELGIKFYLDDFGTGYSNFERIMEIPFDIIKFDRSLLIESLKSDSSRYMVKTFANMFDDLKYAVLFEGVENENDENRCIMMKAKYLQGYKYSKPIPIAELKNFLHRDRVKTLQKRIIKQLQ